MTADSGPDSTWAQRWLARLSFVFAGLAVAVVVAEAGLRSIAMLAVGVAAAAVSLAAAYHFLSRRGPPRPPFSWARLRHLAAPRRHRPGAPGGAAAGTGPAGGAGGRPAGPEVAT